MFNLDAKLNYCQDGFRTLQALCSKLKLQFSVSVPACGSLMTAGTSGSRTTLCSCCTENRPNST